MANRVVDRLVAAKQVIPQGFTEADLNRALEKIEAAASTYPRQRYGSLDQVESGLMDPGIFKEFLRRQFGVRVDGAELWALMAFFDKDDRGVVDPIEFLISFFRITEGSGSGMPLTQPASSTPHLHHHHNPNPTPKHTNQHSITRHSGKTADFSAVATQNTEPQGATMNGSRATNTTPTDTAEAPRASHTTPPPA
ncbi:unnamed protein product, partial [Discosporangium mesarthrocarpum]